MPRLAHRIGGVLAPLCIATFFLSTILAELFGSREAVAQLKSLIVTPGLWILIPAIAAAGGSVWPKSTKHTIYQYVTILFDGWRLPCQGNMLLDLTRRCLIIS
jgi:hypothetical protein